MNITRHNYEEFFLLLADGELSPAQEDAVLEFAKLHPDLEEELSILMECRLEADASPVFPKEKLLKPVEWNVDEPEAIQLQLLDLLDNELHGEEKKLLEEKIASDASLRIEWETLHAHAKLPAEPAPNFPKEKLLKPTIWNVEEPDTVFVQMMNLLDNELLLAEKQDLEHKIAADASLAIEWQSLQQARLTAEAVVFPNKESLYREKEQRRIGGWIRWAAAAAVIFGLGWFFWPKTGADNLPKEMAVNTKNGNSEKVVLPSKNQTVSPAENTSSDVNNNPSEQAATTNENNSAATLVSNKTNRQIENENLPKQQNIFAQNGTENNNNSSTIAAVYNSETEVEPATVISRKMITGSTSDINETELDQPRQLSAIPANLQQSKTELFRTASYTDADIDNGSDDDVVYIAGARLNKQKVRGVFRGITRSLGRTFSKSKVEPGNEPTSLTRSLEP